LNNASVASVDQWVYQWGPPVDLPVCLSVGSTSGSTSVSISGVHQWIYQWGPVRSEYER